MPGEGIGPGPTIVPPLVDAKVAEFTRIEPVFMRCFAYVQAVQGQARFSDFPVEATVRYLHALWVCHLKDCLLDVPHGIDRYEGPRALRVLAAWQEGAIADIIDHLQERLGSLPVGQLTRQMAAQAERGAEDGVERLEHGRRVLLNRGMTLMLALQAICSLPAADCARAAQEAAIGFGYTPEAIARELAKLDAPLYQHVRHPMLARRNMLVMNRLGERVTSAHVNRPGDRTDRVQAPTLPRGPYAQEVITGVVELTPPPYSTDPYFPAYVAREIWLNGASVTLRTRVEPTGEIELYPDMDQHVATGQQNAVRTQDEGTSLGGLMSEPGDTPPAPVDTSGNVGQHP